MRTVLEPRQDRAPHRGSAGTGQSLQPGAQRVAEGITNALRHGNPSQVTVDVRLGIAGQIEIDVCDNGAGGTVVPGIGLTSLLRRAEQLGGRLHCRAGAAHGRRLHVELPVTGAAA